MNNADIALVQKGLKAILAQNIVDDEAVLSAMIAENGIMSDLNSLGRQIDYVIARVESIRTVEAEYP